MTSLAFLGPGRFRSVQNAVNFAPWLGPPGGTVANYVANREPPSKSAVGR